MINFEMFLVGALITSVITGLVTEAIKKIFMEYKIMYHANTLAGIVAVILSLAIGIGYVVITGMGFNAQTVVYLVILVFISWLCSMVGYDKVIQTIKQFKMDKEGESNE